MDGSAFVESEPVTNDGDDAHRARGVSLFRPRQSCRAAAAAAANDLLEK